MSCAYNRCCALRLLGAVIFKKERNFLQVRVYSVIEDVCGFIASTVKNGSDVQGRLLQGYDIDYVRPIQGKGVEWIDVKAIVGQVGEVRGYRI